MNQIQQSIHVNAPLSTVYNQWTQCEEFPRFMEGVREVRQIDDAHLHWRAMRHGCEVEWNSEIIDQVPDELIAWRDVDGPENHGSIHFQSIQGDTTRIDITLEMPVQPTVGDFSSQQTETAQRIAQDLVRFKHMLEAQKHESGAWRGQIHEGKTISASTRPPSAV